MRTLEELRVQYLQAKDTPFANSTWARLEELRSLKKQYTDKDGNWQG